MHVEDPLAQQLHQVCKIDHLFSLSEEPNGFLALLLNYPTKPIHEFSCCFWGLQAAAAAAKKKKAEYEGETDDSDIEMMDDDGDTSEDDFKPAPKV